MASSRRTITRSTADASSAVTVSSQKGILDSAKVAKPGNRLTDMTDPSDQEDAPECSICLQPCIHAVQLPCTHVFCFLCVKGIANQSKKCALCRQEIPPDFIYKPLLLRKEELEKEVAFDGGYQWFYEGNRGWWQYDERASSEIEERFKKEEKVFEMLIAGFLYVIDMENMIQYRRNDPTRRRKIKRDLTSIPDKKGVAGLQCVNKAPLRKDGDGGIEDRGTAQAALPQPSGSPSHAGSAPQTAHPPPPIPPRSCHVPHLPSADSSQVTSGATENEDSLVTRSPNSTQGNHTPTQSVNSTTDSPEQSDLSQPHNTPQTPESVSEGEEGAEGGSEGEDELEHDSGKEESAVTSEMSNLCLGNSSGHGHHRGQLHIPSRSSRQRHETKAHSNRIRFIQSPSSSDSEWD